MGAKLSLGRVSRLIRIPVSDWLMIVEVSVFLMAAQIRVKRSTPVQLARALAPQWQTKTPRMLTDIQATKVHAVARSIHRVIARSPYKFVCLPQALAGHWMLTRRGLPSRIYFGTPRSAQTGRTYHAWLKSELLWVTGHCDEDAYITFDKPTDVGANDAA